jgi:hypothetical protein
VSAPQSSQLFSVRIIAAWLAAAALACALSLFLLTRDTAQQRPGDTEPTIYSRSALGYAALYNTLSRLGIPVAEGTSGAGPPANASVVVIAEPRSDDKTLEHVRAVLHHASAVLLVLPKRKGRADPERPDWIARDRLLDTGDVHRVLGLVDEGATVGRLLGEPVESIRPLVGTASIALPQFVRSTAIDPWLKVSEGIVAGELQHGPSGRVVVVADPDLLENHGLTRGDNALIAIGLVRSLREQRAGPVVFDEVVHGYVSRPFGGLQLLLSFPFVLVTLQIVVAAALLLWAGSARFGAPKPREAALAAGKSSLIETGARLFAAAGKLRFVAERYADAVLRETAQHLHAPRGLSRDELLAWFARTGRPAPATAPGEDAASVVAAAQTMHTWRRDALDESGRRTQHR